MTKFANREALTGAATGENHRIEFLIPGRQRADDFAERGAEIPAGQPSMTAPPEDFAESGIAFGADRGAECRP
jgi:hypothetical protein